MLPQGPPKVDEKKSTAPMINVLASVEEDPMENDGGDPMGTTQA